MRRPVRQIAHPGRVIGMGLVILLILAGAFVAGRLFQPPSQPDPREAAQQIDVWAVAGNRVVSSTAAFAGSSRPGATRRITVEAGEPSVVVKTMVTSGERVQPGDAAGIVSGETFIFLTEPLALYRDLAVGDRGEDVRALQQALTEAGFATASDGVFGRGTAQSVRALFRSAGSPLPADLPVTAPYRQFIPLPDGGAVVSSAAPYGARLSAEVPLLTLQTSAPYVEFVADVTQVDALGEGQEVEITSESGKLIGTIGAIGKFRAGQEGSRSGHPIRVSFDESAETAPPEGQTVTVSVSGGDQNLSTLAVPQTAIRSDGAQSFVLVQSARPAEEKGSTIAERRVDVTVERTGGGYAAISGDVSEGDRVKVS